MAERGIAFIDLFAGIGGIRLGMEQAGFKCIFSSEIDQNCQKTYQANFGEVPYGDITKIDAIDIPRHDILCAGFPCQPFSISGYKRGFEDARGTLFFEICRILNARQPEALLLENVKYLRYHDRGNTLTTILSCLHDLGYQTSWKVLNAKDFGIPQNRERIVIVGSKHKIFDFDAIKTQDMVCLDDFLPQDGNFEYLDPSDYTLLENPHQNENSGLIFAGYLNHSLRKKGVLQGTECLSRSHHMPDRIYSSKGAHPTISSQETSGRYYILTSHGVRKLTMDECRKLMGFPDFFIFPCSKSTEYRQLGNSVAVPMMHAAAEEIKRQLFTEDMQCRE